MSSDAQRGPVRHTSPRQDQPPTKEARSEGKRTPALARLTWNGHPGLTPNYARYVGWVGDDAKGLRRLLRDPETAALAIFDCAGPRGAHLLALELLRLADEVA